MVIDSLKVSFPRARRDSLHIILHFLVIPPFVTRLHFAGVNVAMATEHGYESECERKRELCAAVHRSLPSNFVPRVFPYAVGNVINS